MNDARRRISARRRKQDAQKAQRQKAHTRNAISNMQKTANIFGIKTDQSFKSVELIMQAAQKRALDAAVAKRSGLGQNVNKLA